MSISYCVCMLIKGRECKAAAAVWLKELEYYSWSEAHLSFFATSSIAIEYVFVNSNWKE